MRPRRARVTKKELTTVQESLFELAKISNHTRGLELLIEKIEKDNYLPVGHGNRARLIWGTKKWFRHRINCALSAFTEEEIKTQGLLATWTCTYAEHLNSIFNLNEESRRNA